MPLDPDYELFVSVADEGSLSSAARRHGISPAMVSKRIARLEHRLGVRLLNRTTRRLALTPAGAVFHRDLNLVLETVRAAEERVTGMTQEPAGPLRVSAPTSFGRLHVAPALPLFLDRWPRVELELLLSDAYADLIADRIDVAIRIAAEVPTGLIARRLAANRRLLTTSPAYVARWGMPDDIKALAGHRLLAAEGQLPWTLVNGRKRHVVTARSHVRTNSSEIVRDLAVSGVGIALRSVWDVSRELENGQLVHVLPDWRAPDDLALYAMHLTTPIRPPAVQAFISFLEVTFAPAPWERHAAEEIVQD